MSEVTQIEWTDSTFNYWEGCQKVGPGCDHCYAETRNARFAGGVAINWGPGAPRRLTSEKNRNLPHRWNARMFLQCTSCGHRHEGGKRDVFATYPCPSCKNEGYVQVRRRVFCSSLSDVFDNAVDPAWRADLFAIMEATPNLDWLVLTKRVGNVRTMVPARWLEPGGWPKHVRIGATIVNQEEADRDIPKLLALSCPNFLSMEPLLGAVAFNLIPANLDPLEGKQAWDWFNALTGQGVFQSEPEPDQAADYRVIDWVIVGGETGPGARPMHPDWARGLRDQCVANDVPFLFKQWGDWSPRGPESLGYPLVDGVPRVRLTDTGENGSDLGAGGDNHVWMQRAGKKIAGRHLDGVTHDGFPA